MKTSDFHYDLPKDLIAQRPVDKRDSSRLLVLERGTGSISHRSFADLLDLIPEGDLVVANNTRVLPARLIGRRETGGKVEFLLHKRLGQGKWEVIVKPSRRIRENDRVEFGNGVSGKVRERLEEGKRIVVFSKPVEEWLDAVGSMPLPPYIRRQADEKDRDTYQTVYAQNPGAVAAPTAGLHFTPELLSSLEAQGIGMAHVCLHVGLGTFRPVHAENMEDHRVESEWAQLNEDAADRINASRESGAKVWAVGTTSVRTLEAFAGQGRVQAQAREIDLYIHPPFNFQIVDRLITNFHLPCSSLLALVCAFGGYDRVMEAYRVAVREGYRFYSYGDAMAIV